MEFIKVIDACGNEVYFGYIDSTHVKGSYSNCFTNSTSFHIKQLEDNSYYAELVVWMDEIKNKRKLGRIM